MRPTHPGHERCPSELTWERERLATASNPAGHELLLGKGGGWDADHLFSLALQSGLMSAFLERAERAGLHPLGYMSSGDLRPETSDGREQKLVITSCVVVGSEAEREVAWSILHQAMADSHLCRMLGDGLVIAPHIVATSPSAG